MTSTSLLMFSPEFSLERELLNTSVLSSHTWIKTYNLIICRQVKEEIKGMDIIYIYNTSSTKHDFLNE